MGFLTTFALLLALFIGLAWFFGDESPIIDRSVLYAPTEDDEYVASLQNIPFTTTPTVSVHSINGPIKIIGHAHKNIVIQVTKRGDRKQFNKVHAKVHATKDSLIISTHYETRYTQSVALEYTLSVPFSTRCKLLKTTNGSISLERVYGPIQCETVNGEISINDSKSSIKAYSGNGTIKLIVNKATDQNSIDLTTVNGFIECQLPQKISATLRAKTHIGTIKSAFPVLSSAGFVSGQELSGTIGAGKGALISLKTSNGSIIIDAKE